MALSITMDSHLPRTDAGEISFTQLKYMPLDLKTMLVGNVISILYGDVLSHGHSPAKIQSAPTAYFSSLHGSHSLVFETACDFVGTVSGTVVHHDALKVGIGLAKDASDGLSYILLGVVGCHNNANHGASTSTGRDRKWRRWKASTV